MKTKWHECILWSVLSLGLLCCAVGTTESPVTRRKSLFLKLGTSKSRLTTTESSPASGSSLSQLRSQARSPPLTPVTPPPMRPAKPEEAAGDQADFAFLHDVSVTCSTSDFVVRVNPAFYGLGAHADELTLGSSCKSNGVLTPYGDILFTYPLTACDAVREAPSEFLIYKSVLHYQPSAKRLSGRAHPIDVVVECRYQRNHHVYQLAVKPTWETAVMRKKLKGRPSDFKIELMDNSWSAPVKKQVYHLGELVNIKVTALHLPPGGKVYISSCYAVPFSASDSSLKYTIIGNLGCMLDSMKHPGASQFLSQTDKTLQFSLRAFQFTSDPDTEVSIHCKLSVTSEDPSPAHKSCTYKGNRWQALSGDNSICACCDSQCVTQKFQSVTTTGFASSDLLLVSDQPYTAEDSFLPVGSSAVIVSRENEPTSLPTDELNRQEYPWKSKDGLKYDGLVEEEKEPDKSDSSVILGLTSEPDVETLVFRHGSLVEERNEFEDGSGYDTEEEFLEGEEEEEEEEELSKMEEGKISAHGFKQKGGKVVGLSTYVEQVKDVLQEEKPLSSEEKRKYSHGVYHVEEEDDSLADIDKMTWYFTWR